MGSSKILYNPSFNLRRKSDRAIVICARNEEKILSKTLPKIRDENKEVLLVLIDDGSIDKTQEIAKKYSDVIIKFPFHKESFAGRPELAIRYNTALSILPNSITYVMILGADTLPSKKYFSTIVKRMKKDHVTIASGILKGEEMFSVFPRGSGRVYEYKFLKEINFFPVGWGWESYVVFKCLQMGRKIRIYKDLKLYSLRKTKLNTKKLAYWGKAMKNLGYTPLFALMRSLKFKNFNILEGYFSHSEITFKEIVPVVRKYELLSFFLNLKLFIKEHLFYRKHP